MYNTLAKLVPDIQKVHVQQVEFQSTLLRGTQGHYSWT